MGLDRGGQPPVQLGAIGFELGFVGHGADQRMVEHVGEVSGEGDLIDELRPQQVLPGQGRSPVFPVGPGRTSSR